MANVVITKTGNSIIVDFGVYVASNEVDYLKSSYLVNDLVKVSLVKDSSHVELKIKDAHSSTRWALTYDSAYGGSEYFIIDTVDGVAPTSELDLFNKLTALRG